MIFRGMLMRRIGGSVGVFAGFLLSMFMVVADEANEEPVAAPKLVVKAKVGNSVSVEFVAKSGNLYNFRWMDEGTGAASRIYVGEGEKFADRFSVIPKSFEERVVRDERLLIDRNAGFLKIRDSLTGQEHELQKRVPKTVTAQKVTLGVDSDPDGELTIYVGAIFNLSQDGLLRPHGKADLVDGTWYRLMDVQEDEAIISPCNKDGEVEKGAKKLRLDQLSRDLRLPKKTG